MGRFAELVAIPLRAMRRAVLWWSVGLAALIAATVAFWPAFRGTSGISSAIDQLPGGLVQALGLQDFNTPAGYLRGNLYELFIPLLLTLAAISLVMGQTASEETSGRMELILAQSVDHRAVLLARAIAVLIGLTLITAAMAVAQLVADGLVGLAIDVSLLLSTIILCMLLGLFHGAIAIATAGAMARPPAVLGIAIAVALAGYFGAALLPLVDALAPWRQLSPWYWALGGNPLITPTEFWRYAALALPAVGFALFGLIAFGRRDIASG